MKAIFAGLVVAGGVVATTSAMAQDVPESFAALMAENDIEQRFLENLDAELAVPQAWLDAAEGEGAVRINGAWDDDQFQQLVTPFKERYPFVEVEYTRGSFDNRVTRPILAFRQGRHIVDITTGFTGATGLFTDANALVDLSDLPSFDSVLEDVRSPNGTWVAHQLRYWCLAYNTDEVDGSGLPDTWEGIVGNPNLLDGTLAMNDRAMTWMLPLWAAWGDEKSTAFITGLFEENNPAQRKEGVNAMTSLTAAGETLVSLPAADYRVFQNASDGGAIAWHCPEPIPVSVSEVGIISNSPQLNSAKIFVNWLLSSEGQIAQFFADYAPPSNIHVMDPRFGLYPEEVEGKALAFLQAASVEEDFDDMQAIWAPAWEKALTGAN